MTVNDMIEQGYRAYVISTSFIKRHIDSIQKRLGLEIVVAGDNLLFVKTKDYIKYELLNKDYGTSGTDELLYIS